ncbi:hypothetical protein AB1Y20_014365 [Prymnesium parvum]|uniref:Dolichol kinase n=1 Tax=Prymnesium parvum TaxID=97485 RepID=A0AB34IG05_PRYPA
MRHAALLALFAPPLALLADFSGEWLSWAAVLTLLLVYLVHALFNEDASLLALWGGVSLQALGHTVNLLSTLGACALVCFLVPLVGCLCFLFGLWATLQFDFILSDNPPLALLIERLLHALLPLNVAVLTAWALCVSFGAHTAPPALLLTHGIALTAITARSPSALSSSPLPPPPALSEEATRVHAASLLLLPSALHLSLNHAEATPAALALAAARLLSLALLLLAALPHATLLLLLPSPLPPHAFHAFAAAFAAFAAAAHSSHPWGEAVGQVPFAATAAALAAAAALLLSPSFAKARGAPSSFAIPSPPLPTPPRVPPPRLPSSSSTTSTPCRLLLHHLHASPPPPPPPPRHCASPLHLTATPHHLHASSPPPLSPPPQLITTASSSTPHPTNTAPHLTYHSTSPGPPVLADLISACVSSLLVASLRLPAVYEATALVAGMCALRSWRRRDSVAYALLCLCLLAIAFAWLRLNTGLVDHVFAGTNVSLTTIVGALLALLALGAVICGSFVLRRGSAVALAAMLAHSLLLAAVEFSLLSDDPQVYPTHLLFVSVGTGLFLCIQLYPAAHHAPTCWWASLSLTLARASPLLASPHPSSYAAAALLAAAATQRLHVRVAHRALGAAAEVAAVGGAQLLARLLLVTIAVASAHADLLPRALEHLSIRPTPPTLTGASFLLGGAASSLLLPTVANPTLRSRLGRLCFLLSLAGCLLAALQPVVDARLLVDSIGWTLLHPTASLTFGGTPRLLLWPKWLMIALILAAAAAAVGGLPLHRISTGSRLALFAVAGAVASLVCCGALLPLERSLFLLSASSAALASLLFALCAWPHLFASSAALPAALTAAWAALLPAGLYVQHRLFAHSPVARMHAALPAYRAMWIGSYAGAAALIALAVKLQLHQTLPPRRAAASAPRPAVAMGREREMRTAGSARLFAPAAAHARWMAAVGNLTCVLSFALCLALHVTLMDGSVRGVLPTSLLLLLLNPHEGGALSHANRYGPVVTAVVLAYAATTLHQLGAHVLAKPALLRTLRGVVFFVCPLPSQMLACQFSWDGRYRSAMLLWCCLPLNLVPVILSHSHRFREAGFVGIAAGVLHLIISTRKNTQGLKVI